MLGYHGHPPAALIKKEISLARDYSGCCPRDPIAVNLEYIKSHYGDAVVVFYALPLRSSKLGCDGHAPFALTKKEISLGKDYSGCCPRDPMIVNLKYIKSHYGDAVVVFLCPIPALKQAWLGIGHKKTLNSR